MGRSNFLFASIILLGISGCAKVADPVSAAAGGTAVNPAETLLDKSMDMYKGLHSFKSAYAYSDATGTLSISGRRTFEYDAPNSYRAVAAMSEGTDRITITSVSDGKKVVEYSSVSGSGAQSVDAPATITSEASMWMVHPMFDGTLLYKFFGGSAGHDDLVDKSKGAPTLGTEEKEPTETARHVKFYGTGMFGNSDALIGETSYKVYQIAYDCEPLMAQVNASHTGGGKALSSKALEKYTDIELNPSIPSTEFVAAAPKGVEVADANAPKGPDGKPPVPIGSKAPEFKLSPLGGGPPVSLASLRGKPVLLDFWATWCPPCRESLPHTQAIYNDLKSKGLQVMVVSNEDAPTIKAFIDKNKYTFPVFRDVNQNVGRTYKAEAIPMVVIIDKEGKLQNYFVGLREESVLRDALKKVGVE